ncbi:MAG: hypothetical protein J6X49_06080 [Victivallales bacterium]|nr:hypothetical protein [Victivallales bacterium]
MSEQGNTNLDHTSSPLKSTEQNEGDLTTLHTEADLIAQISRPSDNFQPPDDEDPLEAEKARQVPLWLNIICFIAILTMAGQIKLPILGGFLAIADLGFLAAFISIIAHLFISKKTIHIPWMAPAAIAVFAIANVFAKSGLNGGLETAQLAEQLFGGLILFAFMTEYAPGTTLIAVTTALLINLVVAGIQYYLYGYYMTIAPADIKALSWGIGPAMTGLFRSRMAFSFFIAASLAWCIPQWLAGPDKYSTRNINILGIVFAILVIALFFIPNAQMLIIAIIVTFIATSYISSRASIAAIAAAIVALFILFAIPDPLPKATFLSTISPLKGADYVADATILFNRKTPAEPQDVSEVAHELKSCHYDFFAALRMASRRPWYGVGSGKYQTNIRRCYQPDLPSPPGVNDIETDTQAAWGILPATVGFPAAAVFALLLLTAFGANFRRSETSTLNYGAALAIAVFFIGMFISDPLTRGLGWFLALAIASSTLPRPDAPCECGKIDFNKIIGIGVVLGILTIAVACRKSNADPLAEAPVVKPETPAVATPAETAPAVKPTETPAIAQSQSTEQPATQMPEQQPAAEKPFTPSDNELLKVLNASVATQITAPMEKAEEADAPDGTILVIPDGKGVPPQGKQPELEYGGCVFEFETTEDFNAEIWLNVVWDGSCGNTIDIRVDDEKKSVTVGNDGTYNVWHWMKSPKSYKLRTGKHKLYILNREDGIKFAQAFITNDKNLVPQGFEEE